MRSDRWGGVSSGVVGEWRVGAGEVLLDVADVDGVPANHGVGEQVQAQRLGVLFVFVRLADLASIGVEDVLGQGVDGLAFVELAVDAPLVSVVVQVGQQRQSLCDPTVFLDGFCERVARRSGLQFRDQD